MIRFVATACIALCLIGCARATAAEDPGLTKLLAAEAARFPGKLTVYVKQLTTGMEASVEPDVAMSSMSVIKLGILAKAYQMVESGALDLDGRVAMKSTDLRGGSGIFQYHTPGLNPTLRDLLWEMVITSDNTATDVMLGRVGGVDELNRWFTQRGLGAMQMQSTVAAYFARVGGIVMPRAKELSEQELNAAIVSQRSGELSAAGKTVAAELAKLEPWMGICDRFKGPSDWLGSITARSVGSLLEQMETGTVASKPHSAEMMDMLKSQLAGARRIPMYIDQQYVIAHKTGDFSPCIANDVGVVYLKSGATVMVFLSDQIRGNYGEAESRIGDIARHVAEYFDGK
jgi:beta-lactamase class A